MLPTDQAERKRSSPSKDGTKRGTVCFIHHPCFLWMADNFIQLTRLVTHPWDERLWFSQTLSPVLAFSAGTAMPKTGTLYPARGWGQIKRFQQGKKNSVLLPLHKPPDPQRMSLDLQFCYGKSREREGNGKADSDRFWCTTLAPPPTGHDPFLPHFIPSLLLQLPDLLWQ